MTSFESALEHTQRHINQALQTLLSPLEDHGTHLIEAIRYAALNGGKRIRPFFCLEFGQLFGAPHHQLLRVASAIEVVQSYSLIHDDLPAMDDADLRRGKPSCHIQFDEPTAILAGDAMLAFAFEILSEAQTHPDPLVRCTLINELARTGGPQGMALGQMMDMEWEGQSISLDKLKALQKYKTGRLIEFSCVSGTYLVDLSPDLRNKVRSFGEKIGLLFQVVDDLLDATGTSETLGKPTTNDGNKTTFPSLLGLDQAKTFAQDLHKSALQDLKSLNQDTSLLEHACDFVLTRTR